MGQLITGLRLAQGVLLLVVGAVVLRTARVPSRRGRWPAGVALVLFGVAALGGLARHAEVGPVRVLDIVVSAFLLSGLAVAEFRHRVRPVPTWRRWFVLAGSITVLITAMAIRLPADSLEGGLHHRVATVVLLGWWSALTTDATVAFWKAARTEVVMARRRLRLLAVAHGAVLITIVLAMFSTTQPEPIELPARLLVVVMIPVIYVALLPPRWLRRRWQLIDSTSALAALHDLMARSARTTAVRESAASWARRLLGAEGGIAVTEGEVSADGLAPQDASAVLDVLGPGHEPTLQRIRVPFPALAVSVPIHCLDGPGRLIVVCRPRGEVVGDDEVEVLGRFAAAVAVAHGHALLVRRLEQQSHELSQLIELKDALLGSMGHDLRNPLTAVSGLVDVLTSQEDELDDVQRRDLLERVAGNARRMNLLLADLVDVRRTESAPLARERHDLLEVVRDIPVCSAHPRVDVEGEPTVGCLDAGLVRRAVENLVVNALDHTDGRVTVAVRSAPDGVEVVVSDRGRGIPDPLKERVFHPGVQGPHAVAGRGEGVGLFLVARIAALHEGRAWVEDSPDGGARFVLSLPAVPGAEEGPVPARHGHLSAS